VVTHLNFVYLAATRPTKGPVLTLKIYSPFAREIKEPVSPPYSLKSHQHIPYISEFVTAHHENRDEHTIHRQRVTFSSTTSSFAVENRKLTRQTAESQALTLFPFVVSLKPIKKQWS
jgi:hypothetical protein